MTVFRLYFDKDKETEWLNSMAESGHAMMNFFAGFYKFVPCEKGEWQYQIDIGKGFFKADKEYEAFMKEMGIEIVQCWGPWVILRRKACEGEFQLYTDVDSQIEQYKKILLLFKCVTGLELACLLLEIYGGIQGVVMGWAFTFLILAIICAFMNIIVRTKDILAELRERKGEGTDKQRGRKISPTVVMGLLLNSVNILAAESIPRVIRVVMLVIALGLILYGTVETLRKKN